ncbi:MAG: SMC-Scp complex subunit ScpB [Alphaproteobacteria bacterium]|nr:SMC-Scp complex subunit ScpB [Alphaproteobacteria bacterium]
MTQETLDEQKALQLLEAVLFAQTEAASLRLLQEHFPPQTDLAPLLLKLSEDYKERGINLVENDGVWSFCTAPDLAPLMKLTRVPKRKLPKAAAEVLAIIAYHQPVTRAEIESVRGVETSRGTLDILLEMDWIRPGRRRETPGRPLTWKTTPAFLSHFNLTNLKELPGLEDLKAAGLLDARPVMENLPKEDNDTAQTYAQEDDEHYGHLAEE